MWVERGEVVAVVVLLSEKIYSVSSASVYCMGRT